MTSTSTTESFASETLMTSALTTSVRGPSLLVADEPTGELDRQSADDVLDLLDRLNTEFDKTIVMVTHDPAAAERAKVLRKLDKGKLQ